MSKYIIRMIAFSLIALACTLYAALGESHKAIAWVVIIIGAFSVAQVYFNLSNYVNE